MEAREVSENAEAHSSSNYDNKETGVLENDEFNEIEGTVSSGGVGENTGEIPQDVLELVEKTDYSSSKNKIETGAISESEFGRIEGKEYQELTSPREIYNRALEHEPEISSDIRVAADSSGSRLEGYEYRIKSWESYDRKVNTIADTQEVPPEKAAESIKDVIRYTEVAEGDKLSDAFNSTLSSLEKEGYSIQEVKNTWLNEGQAYKGVNVSLKSPQGQQFELQFHTPESYQTKEYMHKLYEEHRLPSTPRHRQRELYREMQRMSRGLTTPDNVDSMVR